MKPSHTATVGKTDMPEIVGYENRALKVPQHQEVHLKCKDPKAVIYYTLDGGLPYLHRTNILVGWFPIKVLRTWCYIFSLTGYVIIIIIIIVIIVIIVIIIIIIIVIIIIIINIIIIIYYYCYYYYYYYY